MAIQVRRGTSANFDQSKMKNGEFAVIKDQEKVMVSFADGSAKELAKQEDIPEKLPNPKSITFKGAATGSYDGSQAVTISIPDGSNVTLKAGTVSTLAAGQAATASITGTAPNFTLNLGIPRGADGKQGEDGQRGQPGADGQSPAIEIGSVTTLAAGSKASAEIDSSNYPQLKLNLSLPQGADGRIGEDGAPGADGASPTITIGTVETLLAGSDATAEIDASNYPNLILNLGIPKGDKGNDGDDADVSAIDHSQLEGRDAFEQHPIQAITGLRAELNTIPDGLYIDETNTLFLVKGGKIVGNGVDLPATGGGGGTEIGSKLILKTSQRSFTILESDKTALITYSATSTDTDTGEETGNLTAIWSVLQNDVYVTIAKQNIEQGDNSFDARQYLSTGSNSIKLQVEDVYGNSKAIVFTFTVTQYLLKWNLEALANHGENPLTIFLEPYGNGLKTVKLKVDDNVVLTRTLEASGSQITYSLAAQSHGAHVITAWIEAEVTAEVIKTTPLRSVGVWLENDNMAPVVAVDNDAPEVSLFGTANIKYMVIDPLNQPAPISLKAGGQVISELSVDQTAQVWAYKAKNVGTESLSIVCRSVEVPITLKVNPLPYDISPITDGLILDLDPSGKNNSQSDKASFGYIDKDGVNHPLTFSEGFDWVNGGFQQDNEGVTAFVVKRGDFVTLDRSFFDNTDTRSAGKELKIVFKATNCRNYDAEILNAKGENNAGLVLTAQEGIISSNLASRNVPYCEDSKIEMDINIERDSAAQGEQLATVWLEGVPSRAFAYGDTDSWTQTTPAFVKIGSEEADVWIYRIKLYANSLTRADILQNFIADCGDTDELLDRAKRNDIFTDGIIDIEKLKIAKPQLRIVTIEAERLTEGKEDEVTCRVLMSYPEGGPAYNFIAENAIMKAQGTSSMDYFNAALNLDIDFKSVTSWKNGNGQTITGYSMRENSIPVNYFNVKVNVASSENANNVILADDYNEFQPNITAIRKNIAGARDTVEGVPCAVFFKNTSGSAITVGSRTVASGETILYACGDFNNSKKNFAVFGQNSELYPDICCVEILNNNNAQCLFKSNDLSDELWDGDGSFEFRYPKKPSDAMKAEWKKVLSWVVSTNRATATGAALAEAVTYEGVTYYTDSAEYRLAKFRNEVTDYFNLNSLLYHYLFTERHCMIDNRAKNTFCSYEPDVNGVYKWNFNKDYDNDTAEGNDNSGGLTFTYGIEDIDLVGGKPAFNAADSVLWTNVRDAFYSELRSLYAILEGKGAWSKERILNKFNQYQSARPEALVAEDMYNKYYTAHFNPTSVIGFLAMMLGNKTDQRKRFETYQEYYMSSKYRSPLTQASNIIMRFNASDPADGNIPGVVPYANSYLWVEYDTVETPQLRATKGESYTIECNVTGNLNDPQVRICNAPMLSSVGRLASGLPRSVGAASAQRLQQLLIGSTDITNTAFGTGDNANDISFNMNTFIERLDLRNLPNYAAPLNLSNLTALEELYTTGSNITGVVFAKGAPLETAQLNAVSQLWARDLTKLTTFEMPVTNLKELWLEGNSDAIDMLEIVTNASLLERVRLIGIDWQLENANVLLRLAELKGYDAQGKTTDKAVVTGKAQVEAVSQEDIDLLQAAFPGLELIYDPFVELSLDADSWTAVGDVIFDNENGEVSINATKTGSSVSASTSITFNESIDLSKYERCTVNFYLEENVSGVYGAASVLSLWGAASPNAMSETGSHFESTEYNVHHFYGNNAAFNKGYVLDRYRVSGGTSSDAAPAGENYEAVYIINTAQTANVRLYLKVYANTATTATKIKVKSIILS